MKVTRHMTIFVLTLTISVTECVGTNNTQNVSSSANVPPDTSSCWSVPRAECNPEEMSLSAYINLTTFDYTPLDNHTSDLTSADAHSDDSLEAMFTMGLFVCRAILGPALVAFGIVGNVLILIVLRKGALNSPSLPYFVGLTISDLTFLIISGLHAVSSIRYFNDGAIWKSVYSIYLAFISPFYHSFYTVGILVTLAFTTERYIAICHPIASQIYCTRRRATIVIIFVYIFGIAMNASALFRRRVFVTRDPETNETYIDNEFSALGASAGYTVFNFLSAFIVNLVVPYISMTVLNILIIRQVLLSKKKRSTNLTNAEGKSKTASREGQVTRTLLSIVFMFLTCNSCVAAAYVSIFIIGLDVYVDYRFRAFFTVANMLGMSNSVFNCLLYTFCSRAIRKAVRDLIYSIFRRPSKDHQNKFPSGENDKVELETATTRASSAVSGEANRTTSSKY